MGITAYNEEANIGQLLEALQKQRLVNVSIDEIIVVASGCTNGTVKIVKNYKMKDKKVKLLIQEKREGKASAINLFIKSAKTDLLVLECGDTLPYEDTVEHLVSPFSDSRIGMTSAHILPVNKTETFMGFYVNLFWKLHHQIATRSFKGGEMVAFRKVIEGIPSDTATDETWIALLLKEKGYKLLYVPEARVRNRGPESITDFLKVRRRQLIGYLHLKHLWPSAELPETMNNLLVLKLLLKETKWNLRSTLFTLGAVGLELLGRILATYDWYLRKHNPYIWEIAPSTKTITKQCLR